MSTSRRAPMRSRMSGWLIPEPLGRASRAGLKPLDNQSFRVALPDHAPTLIVRRQTIGAGEGGSVSGRCWIAGRTRCRLPAAVFSMIGALSVVGVAGPAYAQDPTETFAEPTVPTSALVRSGNTTLATDYVFRGFSQTD